MDLKGKKVLFLGDSITAGAGASSYDKSYVPVFAELSGAEAKNYGIGGTRIARQVNIIGDNQYDRDFLMRVDEMDADADIVIVFGGTNDYGHGDAPMGNFESRDVKTFYGAMHCLCLKLLNKYPNADILFMTPLHRENEDAFVSDAGISKLPLSKYVSAIKEVAEYYALPVLDLYSVSGIQPKVDVIKELYMPDGLHPSDKGARRTAERLYGFLSAM